MTGFGPSPVGYRVLKIGLPKLRLSRKLLIITLGITVLLGGTSAAALYFKSSELLDSPGSTIGGECTDVQTMVLKTPSNHLWLRRFIRMENASGPDRVRTALRIAGLLAKKNTVDLIHVSVLDSHGPTLRSQMRGRSIGAEVLIALKPDTLTEMKSPAMASYYEGPVSDAGRYYGDKVVVDIDEIGAMMTAMRGIEEKPDCVVPEGAADAEAKPNDHGKKEEKADHGKKEEHEAKPADAHGEETTKEGADESAHAEEPAKEQGFLDSMLSMVGLGGSEEKPAEDHAPATDNSHAVAEEPADAAAEDHGEKAAVDHEAKPADDEKAAAESHEPAAKAEGHDTAEEPANTHGDESAATEDAKPEDHGVKAETEGHEPAAETESHDAAVKPDQEHGDKAAAESEAKPEDHDTKAEAEGHEPAVKAESHDEAAKPADAASEDHGKKADAHDAAAPAEVESEAPAEAEDHAQPKKPKADEHAEISMPVGD